MPYFKNKYINILFIHIPKTGGTSIENFFSSKFNIPLNAKSLYNNKIKIKLKNGTIFKCPLQHVTYNQIFKNKKFFKVDFNNIKILTIVRNPYERIVSDLFYFKKININTSKTKVHDIIKTYLLSTDYDNHNIPQHLFVTDDNKNLIPNITIMHTESLNDDMKNLGYIKFNVCDNKNTEKVNYYDYLNEDSINIINEFYHLDFILFNYDKK